MAGQLIKFQEEKNHRLLTVLNTEIRKWLPLGRKTFDWKGTQGHFLWEVNVLVLVLGGVHIVKSEQLKN